MTPLTTRILPNESPLIIYHIPGSVIIQKRERTMGAKKQDPENFSFRPFKELKKIMGEKGITISPKLVSPKKTSQLSDEELFSEEMKHVKEIREFRDIPVQQKKIALPIKSTPSDQEALKDLEELIAGLRPVNLPDTQEYVQWINKDYHGDVASRLHEGQFSVQDSLDLHGMIVEEADAEVEHFIRDSIKNGYRCIKIIHGRGLRSPNGPVLKDAVIKWLSGRYRKNIIAFASARQCDGGLGAVYVLLR
jgi:DNA-nicking Smr family endonuclease